ncbi:Myxococcus xanthus paralogous domain TIGR02266 [Stigmatella aurantiaca]|uniref:Myxococcus xanthus paralogous domain TIGR02266 n=1 Tax=Stigmatella aurantiaca TaxID=41 RepID=A0A1H7QYC5_STIAU|nr:PilZ domain-containing protein [Stigmatella aurantiaca]SEL52849.1 Myxococcus xanthus paralogous domain TIGR02266 [Stigmatella aurantiaca]
MAESKISPVSGAEERRESPRVPMRFLVRRAGSEAGFEAYEGDLSLGGCALRGGTLEGGAQVELRLLLPTAPDELKVKGEVLPVTQGGAARVRFLDLSVEEERAIARHLDDLELNRSPR